jgi:hypothetical protein
MQVDLSPEAIYQISTALVNRGDHRNLKSEWADTATRFIELEKLTRDARLGTTDNLTIYVVARDTTVDGQVIYDSYLGYVCTAHNEDEARKLGLDLDGDQRPDVWLRDTTSVKAIGFGAGPVRIIRTDGNFS